MLHLLDAALLEGCPDFLFHAKITVDKHVVKKNRRPIYVNKKTSRSFIGKSDELKRAEENLVLQLRQAGANAGVARPFDFKVWCVFQFYYPKSKYFTKDGRVNRRNVGDLSNLIELPQDALQEAEIITDDFNVVALDYSRRFPWDEPYHALEIFILHPPDGTMTEWKVNM